MIKDYLTEDYLDIGKTMQKLNIRNKTILVTGASGTIASFLIKSLLLNNNKCGFNNKIVAVSRNKKKIKDLFNCDNNIIYKNYSEKIKNRIDYIIHFACPTESIFFVKHPSETFNIITSLTNKYLELAKKTHSRLIYISSMEVYGIVNDRKRRKEDDLGKLSLESPRSSYPLGKRTAEAMCHWAFEEYKTDTVIARLAQTFGPGSKKTDNRLYSYAAKCVLDNKNIVLSTDGNSYGSYVYLSDAVKAIFYIAVKGDPNNTYNVVNDESNIKIKDMCKKIGNKNTKIIFNTGKNYFPNNTKLRMSNIALLKLGWRPKYNLSTMLERYLNYFKKYNI